MRYLTVLAVSCLLAIGSMGVCPPIEARQAQPPAAKAAAGSQINLNTATAEQLEKLPGVGPSTAARILEYRQKNSGFKKIEELMNVRGIGEKTFLKMKDQLSVGTPKTSPQ